MSEQTSIPADPELDPTASYATDQSVVRRLSGLLRASAGARTTYAPATAQPIATLPGSSPEDVVAAVRSARRTQQTWKRVPLAERAAILLRYHDLVLDHRHELVDLVILESGKARKHALRGGRARRAHRPLLRAQAAELLAAAARAGLFPSSPGPSSGSSRRVSSASSRRGTTRSAWRSPTGSRPSLGGQRGGAQAGHPDAADRPAGRSSCCARPACRADVWQVGATATARRSAAPIIDERRLRLLHRLDRGPAGWSRSRPASG